MVVAVVEVVVAAEEEEEGGAGNETQRRAAQRKNQHGWELAVHCHSLSGFSAGERVEEGLRCRQTHAHR